MPMSKPPSSRKPQKQSLAIAYSTKRQAMKGKKAKGGMPSNCPSCGLQGGECDCGDLQKMAEGGEVKDLRPLHTSPNSPNHELDASKEATERSEFGYGDMSESESMDERDMPQLSAAEGGRRKDRGSDLNDSLSGPERDMPQASEPMSLADEILLDRKRRGMSKTQGSAEAPQGNVRGYESDLDNSDSLRNKRGHYPTHEQIQGRQDKPKRSTPTASQESLNSRDDSHVLHMAQGGSISYEEDSEMNESSKVGSLQGAIDASSHSPKRPMTGEMNVDGDDGRESRGLNTAVAHVMSDDSHDQDPASKDSDYEEHDDSLVGEILRSRRNKRRGV